MSASLDVSPSEVFNVNVGILGHVDSGKTSLVKALSTLLSTAALDKNPQSIARGITLDLGFSAFLLPFPSRLEDTSEFNAASGSSSGQKPPGCGYKALQFTLVDCPGHASLIRTIIGGAQIIDMMILVVNVLKGIQTQTAECLVVGEICTKNLIVVLNKVDLIPESERAGQVARVEKSLRSVLKTTKFAECPIVACAACIGGERIAAVSDTPGKIAKPSAATIVADNSLGLDNLLSTMTSTVELPQRRDHGPVFFSIDHCFPIKGQGTVVTGTMLSGCVKVNDMVELPSLRVEKKVKSMQMFHKPVKSARQGDRVGMCLSGLDAKLVERGIACTPGTVPSLHAAVALVQRIRYFKGEVKSGSKVHVTIGHATVLATVTFFGHKELYGYGRNLPSNQVTQAKKTSSCSGQTGEGKSGLSGAGETKADSSGATPTSSAESTADVDEATRSRVALVNDLKAKCSKLQKEKVAPAKKAKLNCDEALAEISALKKRIDDLVKLLPKGALGGKSNPASSKGNKNAPAVSAPTSATCLASDGGSLLPNLQFDWDRDYVWQDELCKGKAPSKSRSHGGAAASNMAAEDDGSSPSPDGQDDNEEAAEAESAGQQGESPVPSLPGLQWALLRFESPVFTPLRAMLIASKLDTDVNTTQCRIAFSGTLVEKAAVGDLSTYTATCDPAIKLFKMKTRVGTISRVGTLSTSTSLAARGEEQASGSSQPLSAAASSTNKKKKNRGGGGGGFYDDVLCKDLFKKETDMKQFIGKKIVTESGYVGRIESSFGQSGKFKVSFTKFNNGLGVPARANELVVLQFKRYLNDPDKQMVQDEECLVLQNSSEKLRQLHREQEKEREKETPDGKQEAKATTEGSTHRGDGGGGGGRDMKHLKGAKEPRGDNPESNPPTPASSSAHSAPSDASKTGAHTSTSGPTGQVPSSTTETTKSREQSGPESSPSGLTGQVPSSTMLTTKPLEQSEPASLTLGSELRRSGTVVKVKNGSGSGGDARPEDESVVIVEGLFTPEEDVKRFQGREVLLIGEGGLSEPTHVGSLLGPFGKGGKCKVLFEGRTGCLSVGASVLLK